MNDKLGIKCRSMKRVKKNQDSTSNGARKETFEGLECIKVMDGYESLMDFIYSRDFRLASGSSRPDEEEVLERDKNSSCDLWHSLGDVHTLLHRQLPPEVANGLPSQDHRDEAAKDFKDAGERFATLYRQVRGRADRCIYVHVVSVEVPGFIGLYGNLGNYSAQGAEHMHVHTKFAMRWLTNKRPHQRVMQAFKWVMKQNYHLPRHPDFIRPPRRARQEV